MQQKTQRKTVAQVVVEVLRAAQKPLTLAEITQIILAQKLYTFNTKDPRGIVRSAIDRRCDGLSRKNAVGEQFLNYRW